MSLKWLKNSRINFFVNLTPGALHGFMVILMPFKPVLMFPVFLGANLWSGYFELIKLNKLSWLRRFVCITAAFSLLLLFIEGLFFGNKKPINLLQIGVEFIVPLTLSLIRQNESSFKNLMWSIYILFGIDALINVSYFMFNGDPLGRVFLSDGIRQRFGGLFGSPLYSLNIQFLGLFSALFLRKNLLLVAPALMISLNTSSRGLWALAILLALIYVFKYRNEFIFRVLIPFLAVVLTFLVVYASVEVFPHYLSDYFRPDMSSSNALRVCAWKSSIESIALHPLFGRHNFDYFPPGFHASTCIDIAKYGIAESRPLQLAQDFGLPLAILAMSLVAVPFFNALRTVPLGYSDSIFLVFTAFVLYDAFVGSFYGSTIVSVFYWSVLFFSDDKWHKEAV